MLMCSSLFKVLCLVGGKEKKWNGKNSWKGNAEEMEWDQFLNMLERMQKRKKIFEPPLRKGERKP